MKPYDHAKIEPKWQKIWAKTRAGQVKNPAKNANKNVGENSATTKKFYSLIEFPYPSGEGLHVGHIRSNTAMDIISHKRRREGYDVLYPIGWDAFGLPTENYAIKTGIAPSVVTRRNTDTFRRQLKSLGFFFDWSREIDTTDPKYYRWTQWIFLQFLKEGLAYKKKMTINWCPRDLIGLANEEVVDGKCERCGTPVEKREKEQWMLAITKYADKLLEGLDGLDWDESIKNSQRNWIGKSEGAEFDFAISSSKKYKYVLLHGYKETPDEGFFPWLKSELEKRGHEVIVPKLPNSVDPKEAEQVDYVLKNCHFDEYTVIVGHSLGAIVAMKVLLKLNKPISGLTIVSAAIDPNFGENHKSRSFHKTFDWNLDYTKINQLTGGKIAVLSDTNEPLRIPYLKYLAEQLSAKLIETASVEKHFNAKIEPVILKSLTPSVRVFTTRADTLFGVTYIVLAPEHPWVSELLSNVENKKEVADYIAQAKSQTDIVRTDAKREKTGVELRGIHAINPANGEEIPVWIADYVLADYGTGAVMAVPAHDERDFDFAKKYGLVFRQIVVKDEGGVDSDIPYKKAYTGNGKIFASKEFNNLFNEDARQKITTKFGTAKTTYKLRDWVFSRQRYWGEPIPVVHCEKCGIVPIPEKDLPVKLPVVKNYKPTGTDESPLASISKWVNVKCPKCQSKGIAKAHRETDTMPQWAGSSWYYLRYTDPKNAKKFAGDEALQYWTPVDWYNGGREHTTLHLLYSRFWHKFLYDQKLVPTSEPYTKRTSHGMILAKNGEKMSKSKGNVVNPDGIVERMGADSLRLYEMFMGPFEQAIAWDENGIVGCRRFIERVWKLAEKVQTADKIVIEKNSTNPAVDTIVHKTIKKVSEDIESMRFNTAVSALMIAINELEKIDDVSCGVSRENFALILQILAPFAPHVTEELWQNFGFAKGKSGIATSIHATPWPTFDPSKIADATVKIAVQINGKTRSSFEISAEDAVTITESQIRQKATNLDEIKKWVYGKDIKKVIYVKGRLVNLVVAEISK